MPHREQIENRLEAMKTVRSSFIPAWQDITTYIQPSRGRYTVTDVNKGQDRTKRIVNSRGTIASRTLASGLMAGLTSPSRPWFELGTPDSDLMRSTPVKEWLRTLTKLMLQIYAAGNVYEVLPLVYMEMGLFGIGCMSHVDDFEDVARFYPHTVGSYVVSQNDRLEVDTLGREMLMSVGQMASKFGYENMTPAARRQYDRGELESLREVVHFVSPNLERDLTSPLATDMPFSSVYYEKGSRNDQWLRQSGFQEAPFYCARWEVTEADTYGTSSPGMSAIGDVKALQILEREKAINTQFNNHPFLKGPASLKNQPVNSVPGGTAFFEGDGPTNALSPVFQVQPSGQEMEFSIQKHESRIDEAFFANLFLQLSQLAGIQPRNELELSQRNEEKLLMLGPLLERVESELLDPLIDRTFAQIIRAEILPPPPPELQGQRLRVTYISPLAVAQRQVSTQTIDRFVNFVGSVAQIDPSAIDNMNTDEIVTEYADMLGTPPRSVRSEDEREQLRQARAEQQQQAQALEAAQGAASAARDLGINVGGQG